LIEIIDWFRTDFKRLSQKAAFFVLKENNWKDCLKFMLKI
jgi:hypothetical protein